jgi:hypothetical protein
MILMLGFMLVLYVFHCIYGAADMYSSPSIVLQSPRP